MREGTVTVDPWDLLTPSALADPFPVYRALREHDPVHWSESAHGWLVTRYDDVVACLKDERLSAARVGAVFERLPPELREETRPLQQAFARWMLMMDPPDHTRLRGLVSKAFAPSLMAALRPRIQQLLDETLDRLLPRGGFADVRD